VSRFAPRHNAANAFARLLQVETVAPFSYPQAEGRIYDVDVLWVCSRYSGQLMISDSSRSLKPIQKIFEDAKD